LNDKRTHVLKISLIAILSAFVVELLFGITSNSLALVTDSIHALLDSFVTVILLLAARMAIKPPDAEHTYGHGKIESLGGLIGGIAILLIASFFIYESVDRIQDPPNLILAGSLALIGGIYTIGVDIFRIVLLRRTLKKVGGVTLKADFYHAFMDLGSTLVAIIGILLVTVGFNHGDFIAALVLGVLLAILSIKLIYRTALELTDIIPPEMVKQVRGIVQTTQGVQEVKKILMRKSGNEIFADVTISLRADVSFDKAHEISDKVENNITKIISNSKITIHFEPSWKDVPLDSKINEIANSVEGVEGVHNVSSYSSEGRTYVSIHVMVDRNMNLGDAHRIADIIEKEIQKKIPNIEHVTIHLEPHITIPRTSESKGKAGEEKIIELLKQYPEIKKIGRIIILHFKDVLKIDIDCSYDKMLSIEKVHDSTSQIEGEIRNHFQNAVITIHAEPD